MALEVPRRPPELLQPPPSRSRPRRALERRRGPPRARSGPPSRAARALPRRPEPPLPWSGEPPRRRPLARSPSRCAMEVLSQDLALATTGPRRRLPRHRRPQIRAAAPFPRPSPPPKTSRRSAPPAGAVGLPARDREEPDPAATVRLGRPGSSGPPGAPHRGPPPRLGPRLSSAQERAAAIRCPPPPRWAKAHVFPSSVLPRLLSETLRDCDRLHLRNRLLNRQGGAYIMLYNFRLACLGID